MFDARLPEGPGKLELAAVDLLQGKDGVRGALYSPLQGAKLAGTTCRLVVKKGPCVPGEEGDGARGPGVPRREKAGVTDTT